MIYMYLLSKNNGNNVDKILRKKNKINILQYHFNQTLPNFLQNWEAI